MEKQQGSPFELDGRLPLRTALPYGLQHVLAMFIGNLTAPIVILGVCGVAAGTDMYITILRNAMFVAGLVTLVQLYPAWKIGGKLPMVMGTDAGALGVYISVVLELGNGFDSYGVLLGACILGGLIEVLIGFTYKYIEKLFPPIVTGVVLTAMGVSLLPFGAAYFAGGSDAPDFGSVENVVLGLIVLVAILVFQFAFKGFISQIAILLGVGVGYVAAIVMGIILPHSFMYTDASGAVTEVTKSWVLNWGAVKEAAWFSFPRLMPVKIGFDMTAILPICFIFLALTMSTMACVRAVTKVGLGREATGREITGALAADGLGSSVAAFFGVLPNTCFSQNVGIVGMTHVVNRFSVLTGAIVLILSGFCPKLMAVISIMPTAVLGGAVCMMFGSVLVGGFELLADAGFEKRNTTIIAVSFGAAYAIGSTTGSLGGFPGWVQTILAMSGVVTSAFCALILNLVLPGRNGEKSTENDT